MNHWALVIWHYLHGLFMDDKYEYGVRCRHCGLDLISVFRRR